MTTEFTSDEVKSMVTFFKEMGIKPELESQAQFQDSLVKYVSDLHSVQKKVKTEPGGSDESDDENDGASAEPVVQPKTPTYFPKIATFSGDGSKQDIAFEVWKYEVECLVRDGFNEATISLAIRRSLRGEASACVMRLGPDASVADILKRLDDVFGSLERGESIMEQFYSAHQKKDEDTMKWSCRLEEIMRKALEKGLVRKEEHREKLRERYWSGLHQWIKDVTGHKFDTIIDFDQLRREVRLIEKDHDKKSTHQMAIVTNKETSQTDSNFSELKGIINQLTTKMDNLQKQQDQLVSQQASQQRDGRHSYRGRGPERGRFQGQGHWNQGHQYQLPTPLQHTQQMPNRIQNRSMNYRQPQNYSYDGGASFYEEPECYRCGQRGHLQKGCRVILDHSKRGLQSNFNSPGSRGRR